MLKTSFTLFETIISLVILSILISGFSRILTLDIEYQEYDTLQSCENTFYSLGTLCKDDKIKLIQYK